MKILARFVCQFVLLFAVLAWPWPALKSVSSGCFRAQTRLLMSFAFSHKNSRVEPVRDPRYPNLDTVVLVEVRNNHQPSAGPSAVQAGFDSCGQLWIPLAMLAALCLATPLPWSGRLKALLVGGVVVDVFAAATVLAVVSFGLSGENSEGAPSHLLTFAFRLLSENIWFGFVLPLLIWAVWVGWCGHWIQLAAKFSALLPSEPKPRGMPGLENSLLDTTRVGSKSGPKTTLEAGSKP
jgi:hypothetical protein